MVSDIKNFGVVMVERLKGNRYVEDADDYYKMSNIYREMIETQTAKLEEARKVIEKADEKLQAMNNNDLKIYFDAMQEIGEEYGVKISDYYSPVEYAKAIATTAKAYYRWMQAAKIVNKPENEEKIAEYRGECIKKIQNEMQKKESSLPETPIEVVEMLTNAKSPFDKDSAWFSCSELRQIAEHLLVYCDANEKED